MIMRTEALANFLGIAPGVLSVIVNRGLISTAPAPISCADPAEPTWFFDCDTALKEFNNIDRAAVRYRCYIDLDVAQRNYRAGAQTLSSMA